jgi:hypothetical protein
MPSDKQRHTLGASASANLLTGLNLDEYFRSSPFGRGEELRLDDWLEHLFGEEV